MKSFAIVVICYNRISGVKRLLKSLESVDYNGRTDINLIFSIDNSGSDLIENFAKDYDWNYGPKLIRTFAERQGLKKHILQCGDFTEKYDIVVVLEDDIYVSDSMYHYASQAVVFYENDDNIAGISLYAFQKNWLKWLLRFEPQHSEYDAFFLKVAQSWGQVWTKEKWGPFRKWLENNPDFIKSSSIPQALNQWPESSWLKFHDRYCIEKNKYFVYPYVGVSTNCSDAGEHSKKTVTDHQVELMFMKKSYHFPAFSNDAIKYDEFMEREGLGKYVGISDDELSVCLWGTRPENTYNRYILTVDKLPYACIKTFGLSLRPAETNVIYGFDGKDIKLYDRAHKVKDKKKKNDFIRYRYSVRSSDYRTLIRFSFQMLSLAFEDLKRKVKRLYGG